MSGKTIFQRIIDREIPADIVYEDDQCLAMRDIAPQAPVHVLVIPKRPISGVATIADVDAALLGHLWLVIRDLAKTLKLDAGYRVVVNNGPEAGQSVDHLHFHLLGGLRDAMAAGITQNPRPTISAPYRLPHPIDLVKPFRNFRPRHVNWPTNLPCLFAGSTPWWKCSRPRACAICSEIPAPRNCRWWTGSRRTSESNTSSACKKCP